MPTSTLESCLDGVVTAIEGLVLTGIADADIRKQKLPWDRTISHPGIIVHPVQERYSGRGTNLTEGVGYGVMVTILQASNRDLTGSMGDYLYWREQIRQHFHHKPQNVGVASVFESEIEPASVYLPEAFARQYDVGALIVRCWVRE